MFVTPMVLAYRVLYVVLVVIHVICQGGIARDVGEREVTDVASLRVLFVPRPFIFFWAEEAGRNTRFSTTTTVKDTKASPFVDFEGTLRQTQFSRTRRAPHPALIIPIVWFLAGSAFEFDITVRPLIRRRFI